MKYFVVADIHGFYKPFIQALDNAGFDKNNPDHTLISLGDNFDRGTQSYEVFMFLKELPRKILIKGNHEDILLSVIKRNGPSFTDVANGTDLTLISLAGLTPSDYISDSAELVKKVIKNTNIKNWINNEFVNYFETNNYIFTHGWLPVNWRKNKSKDDWSRASWAHTEKEIFRFESGDGPELYGKKLVVGHWGSRFLREKLLGEYTNDDSILYYKDFIFMDATTADSNKINVLVIED